MMGMRRRIRTEVARLMAWWPVHVPAPVTVLFVAMVTGAGTGLLAELLRNLISWLADIAGLAGLRRGRLDYSMLFLPFAGMLLAMLYQRYVARQQYAHGTARIIRTLSRQRGNFKMGRWGWINSILTCGLTVGLGSSAGSEGPAAYSGASFGSAAARFFRMPRRWVRIMLAIGAGAGIAGIFKSPVGGTLYALEVLEIGLSTLPVIALVLACLTASTMAYLISGYTFSMNLLMSMNFNPHDLGWVALLGIFCGLYSIVYVWSKDKVADMLRRIRNEWLKVVVAGVGMSLVVFMVPAFFGEGMVMAGDLINDRFPDVLDQGIIPVSGDTGLWFFVVLGIILLLKGPLVAAANYGGGVAGEMVPALFVGSVAGYFFGMVLNTFCGCEIHVWYMALAGMAAILGNASHAPLMSIFIVSECTNSMQYMPAYMMCVFISYAVMKVVSPASVWSATDHDDLLDLHKYFVRSGDSRPRGQKPR